MSDNALFYANGIDATTGGYLLPAMTPDEIAAVVRDEPTDADRMAALTKVTNASDDHLGLPFDVDPLDIAQAGWGMVFHADEDEAVKAALGHLLARRTEQVTDATRLKVLEYRTGETRPRWLARHGVAAGNINPARVPFYLLLVGGPSKIPFGFCRELAVEYAVGLLSFDTPAEYAAYAASVVAVEKDEIKPRSRQVTFFAMRHGFDAATQLSRRSAGEASLGRHAVRARALPVRVDLGRWRDARGDHGCRRAQGCDGTRAAVYGEPRDGLPARTRRPAHAARCALVPELGRTEGGCDRAQSVLRRGRRAGRCQRRGHVRVSVRVLRRRHAGARSVRA